MTWHSLRGAGAGLMPCGAGATSDSACNRKREELKVRAERWLFPVRFDGQKVLWASRGQCALAAISQWKNPMIKRNLPPAIRQCGGLSLFHGKRVGRLPEDGRPLQKNIIILSPITSYVLGYHHHWR